MSGRVIRSLMGSLKKISAIRKSPEAFVGKDHFGNKYYERKADPERGIKLVRRIEPPFEDQFRVPEVPAEWMTWLQARRKNPPTEEEIERNIVQTIKTQQRAQDLDAERSDGVSDFSPQEGRTEFPKYDDYELKPGQFRSREKEK